MSKVLISDVAVINKKNIEFNKNLKYINYLDTSSITNNKIDGYQTLYIDKDKIPSRAKRLVKNNTIVYSSVRPRLCHFGILKDLPENPVVSTGFITIDAKEDIIDPFYLYYILTSKANTEYLSSIADTSVSSYPSINPSDISNMEINIIEDINEQKKIANILKVIEFRIENNNKINEELESMAKTIYDYWFLQFEFPNEEGKPYKSSGGKMVWNDELKREVPEGWGKGYLRDILNLHTDTISKKQIKKTDLYTPINRLPKKKMCFYDEALIEEAQSSLIKYRKRDILLGAMRVYFHRVCIAPSDGITRTTTFVLRPKHDKNLGFSYQTINRNDSIDYATKNSIGTQQPYAVWENNLEDFYFAIPPLELMIKYSERVENLIELIIKNTKEIKELISLRDFLLPLLMNGQIGFRELALVED